VGDAGEAGDMEAHLHGHLFALRKAQSVTRNP